MAAAEAIKEAEAQETKAQRDMRGAVNEEARSGRTVEARRRELAKLEAKAEEQGGFDKLEQSKAFGLSKNDIIEAREKLAQAEERERKAQEKTAELNRQIEESRAKRAEAEKQLEEVKKGVQGDTAEREKAGVLRKISPAEAEKAEQVNKAANDNKSNVVIQQNDNRQNQSTEQKTVIEQNKELSGTGSAAALSRAVETAL